MAVEISQTGANVQIRFGQWFEPAPRDADEADQDAEPLMPSLRVIVDGLDENVLMTLLHPPEVMYADNSGVKVSWVDAVMRRRELARQALRIDPGRTNCAEIALNLYVAIPDRFKPLVPMQACWQASDVLRHARKIRDILE